MTCSRVTALTLDEAVPAGGGDPRITIGQMARSIGVLDYEEEMARVRRFYRKAGMRNYWSPVRSRD
ncbi:MAG: hypothetical protein ACYDH9_10805 [Limisphaerales bacterium]